MKKLLLLILFIPFGSFGQTTAKLYGGDTEIVYSIDNMGYGNFVLNQLVADGRKNKNICEKILEGLIFIQEYANTGIFFNSKKEIQKLKVFRKTFQINQNWINNEDLKYTMDIDDFYFWEKKMRKACNKDTKTNQKMLKKHKEKYIQEISSKIMEREYQDVLY